MSYFKPTYKQIIRVRDIANWRLQNFASTRWAMLLCAKLWDSVLEGNTASERELIILRRSMTQIERLLHSTPAEARIRLVGSLEIALLKLRTDGMNTYELLKNYASTFLQVVFSDPALWPSSYNSTSVSLAHVLASDSYEISHFAMLDMMCSMVYGLPQVVDYDTSMPPLDTGIHPAQMVHGCPPELQLVLADINAHSAWKQIGPILDWYGIERKLREWSPSSQSSPGEESWKLVARLAVQESWRHALLIYLYMAVCGAVSNEPRVQSSVRQVFQTMGTVKHEIQPVASAHFFIQCIIAGAFTPNEGYRASARTRLSDSVAANCPEETTSIPNVEFDAAIDILSASGYAAASSSDTVNETPGLPVSLNSNRPLEVYSRATAHNPYGLSFGLSSAPCPTHRSELDNQLAFRQATIGDEHSLHQFIPITLNTQRSPNVPAWPPPSPLPRSPSPTSNDIGKVISYVITQFERLIRLSFFQPAHHQFAHFRESVGRRLQRSDSSLWIKYLTCKMFESALGGTSPRKVELYSRSLQNIEMRLHKTSGQDRTPAESYNQLAGTLEVVFVKLMFTRISAYQLLRDTAPTFLQLAFTDSTLWSEPTGFTSVSLAHVLGSTNYELPRFVLLDALHSMVFGLLNGCTAAQSNYNLLLSTSISVVMLESEWDLNQTGNPSSAVSSPGSQQHKP
ncbi:hypothetical protein FRC07_015143 [Ceratobasidium sp. 392]|nr:hypothetical protein FRC07_015143 [Ceratobasidium sp. 392]